MRYDLITLDVFIVVAEERNLTRAAERLHLAVSAVSKRIAELEEQVGSPLLLRYARGVELTPAGQSLLHYAHDCGWCWDRWKMNWPATRRVSKDTFASTRLRRYSRSFYLPISSVSWPATR